MKIFDKLHHTNFVSSKPVYLINDSLILFERVPPLELMVAEHMPWVDVALRHSDVLVLFAVLFKL